MHNSGRSTPINLRHLRAFLNVCDAGSFTSAGTDLGRSVSAISRSVALLEEHFKVRLLDRGSSHQVPTPEGHIVADRCRAISAELLDCQKQITRFHSAKVPASAALFGMLLDSNHLRALVAVRDFRSVQRAANALNVSQAAVSYALRVVEADCGIPLFLRLPTGMVTTPAGVNVTTTARRVLAEMSRMYDDVRSVHGPSSGQVQIGALAYSRSAVLPHAIKRMLDQCPEVSVRTVEGHIEQLIAALHGGDLDALLCALPDKSLLEGISVEPFVRDRLGMFVRGGHPLTGCGHISPQHLLEYEFILPPAGTMTRSLLEGYFSSAGLPPPKGRVETSSDALVRALLTDTDLVAFRTLRQFGKDPGSAIVPLAMTISPPERDICVLRRSGARPTAALERLLGLVRETALGD